jgi:CDGSH-type Zn-finger protein
MSAGEPEIRPALRICPAGPMLVRGVRSVVTDDGAVHPVQRPVIALCRCGLSTRTPYCDGTHKVAPTVCGPGLSAGGTGGPCAPVQARLSP